MAELKSRLRADLTAAMKAQDKLRTATLRMLLAAIAQVAEEIGERPGMKQMGLVMKAATAIAAGKADGARLSAAVKERL